MQRYLLGFILFNFFINTVLAQSSELEAVWDDGLKFRSKDKRYSFSVGGRVHYDIAFVNQNAALDTLFTTVSDKVQVRRARLTFEGSINNALEYEFEFTFGETIRYADMYLAFLRIPYFERLTIGHFREPFGMEELTSSNTIVFMERSLTSAFGPSRNTGIMLQRQFMNNKLRGYAGIFRITDNLGADVDGEGRHSFSSRWAFNPSFDTVSNKALHFGVSINSFKPKNKKFEIKTNNEVDTSPNYINTGEMQGVSNVSQIGGEFGYTYDRLAIQSEYIHSLVRAGDTSGVMDRRDFKSFSGFYAMASYFLKGGIRKYNKRNNRFSDISLTERYEQGSMSGAWEVGLRFSYIDIDDINVRVNRLKNITAGLNWYFNSNSRIMMNYVFSKFNNGANANALQFRFQLAF